MNDRRFSITSSYIKDSILKGDLSTTSNVVISSGQKQFIIKLKVSNLEKLKKELNELGEDDKNNSTKIMDIFKKNGLSLLINRGIAKNNSVREFDHIKIASGLNAFFDIDNNINSGTIDAYIFQEDHSQNPDVMNTGRVLDVPKQFRDDSIDGYTTHINSYIYQGEKSGGANRGGDEGGIYKRQSKKFLIKQEKNIYGVANSHNIAEYLAGQIFAETAHGYGAEVSLVSIDSKDMKDETGENTYIASKFFDHYDDLYAKAHKDAGLAIPNTRPRIISNSDADLLKKSLVTQDGKAIYDGFPEIMVTSLLIGDYDVHWGNVGVISEGDSKRLVRIDFGWAFKKLDANFSPHSITNNLPIIGPTNHFREYPPEIKITYEFAAELKRVAKIDLNECLEKSCGKLNDLYGIKPLQEFAFFIGMKKSEIYKLDNADMLVQNISTELQKTLKSRQEGLLVFAAEIELSLCIDRNLKPPKFNSDRISEFVNNNQQYCIDILSDQKKAHLRETQSKHFFIEILELLGILKSTAKELEKDVKKIIEIEYSKQFPEQSQHLYTQGVNQSKLPNTARIINNRTNQSKDSFKSL